MKRLTSLFWNSAEKVPSVPVILIGMLFIFSLLCYGTEGARCGNKPETVLGRYFPVTRAAFELTCVRWPKEKP